MLTRDEIGLLFKRWYKPIRRWLGNSSHKLLSNGGTTVDDLAQEVFVRLLRYQTAEDMPPIENIQGYLFRIAANIRNEWLERSVIKRLHAPELLDELVLDDELQPDNARESEDLQEAIARCADQLTPRQRQLLTLHVHEGLTYKQIAAKERISYRIVLRDLTRAYTSMRTMMPSVAGGKETPASETVWKQRRIEKRRVDREHELQRERFRQRALTSPETRVAAMIEALEKYDYVVRPAAIALGVKVTTLHFHIRKYIPDFFARREAWKKKLKLRLQSNSKARAPWRVWTPEYLLSVIEENGYNYTAAAKALDVHHDTFKRRARQMIPDVEQRREAWMAERRREQKRTKWRRECERRRKRTAANRAAREAEAAKLPFPVFCGVSQDVLLAALEATSFNLKDAAVRLGISESKIRHVHCVLIPDFRERRERARAAVALRQRTELIAALEENKYSMVKTGQALGKGAQTMQSYVRSLLPEYPAMRAAYLKKHSLGRCGARIERPEEREERLKRFRETQIKTLAEGRRRRWDDGGARNIAKLQRLQEYENQLAQMRETHKQEITDMRNAIKELHRQYMHMRKRQVTQRQELQNRLTHARIAVPGYRETVNFTERRRQREAEGRARKLAVLDEVRGDVHKAAEILGMHHTHIRKWKRLNWQPPELREASDEQGIASAG